MATDFEAEGLLDGVEGEDARRARLALLRDLEGKGFELDELRTAASEGRLPVLLVEHALEGKLAQYTLAEVSELSGLDPDHVKALNSAIGLARPDPDERVFTDADVEGARSAREALDAGLPEDALFAITRVTSRSAAAVAAAAFASVGEAFAHAGDTERDLGLRYAEATRALTPVLDRSLSRLLRIHLRELARQTAVSEEQLRTGRLPETQAITVCFADLVGFTRLGEELEAAEIGAMAERLGEMTNELFVP
jgi:adenylate cyclase